MGLSRFLRPVYNSEGQRPRIPIPSHRCLIRVSSVADNFLIVVRLRNAECGLGRKEPRDCRLRRTRTTRRGVGLLWCEGWGSGGAWQGQVPEWAIECEKLRLCSLMFSYIRLLGEKMLRALRGASAARVLSSGRAAAGPADTAARRRPERDCVRSPSRSVRSACRGAAPSNVSVVRLFVLPAATRAGTARRAIPTIALSTYLPWAISFRPFRPLNPAIQPQAARGSRVAARAGADQTAERLPGAGRLAGKGLLVALRSVCSIRAMRRLCFRMGWVVVVGVAGLAGCSTVTETGRKQLNLIPASQETQLGLSAFTQMKGAVPISRDARANALVEQVGRRIAGVAKWPNAQWEFVVFESEEANAFCLPGGKVGVYSGILPITKDEAGLATVLGHEVAHAAAHHGGERISEELVLQSGGQILGASLSSADPR